MDDTPSESPGTPAAGDERATEGVFLVTAADEASAVLKDVVDGQVHTLSENPGLEVHDAVEGTVTPDPPMDVTWRLVAVDERRPLTLEASESSLILDQAYQVIP